MWYNIYKLNRHFTTSPDKPDICTVCQINKRKLNNISEEIGIQMSKTGRIGMSVGVL